MRWVVVLHRWVSLATAAFLLVATVTGALLLFVDSPSVAQVHVRLFAGATGEWIVNLATAAVLFIVPTGVVLWWRRPRFTIRKSRTLFRAVYDLHNVLGFYAAVILLLLAATGAFLAFERPLALMFRVAEWRMPDAPHSVPREGASVSQSAILAAIRTAIPGAAVTRVTPPRHRTSAVRIETRGPGVFDQATVYLDRYSGAVLRVDALASAPLWYRMRTIALALHTGNVYGVAGKVVAFLGCAVLAFLIVSGLWMWCDRSGVWSLRAATSGTESRRSPTAGGSGRGLRSRRRVTGS